MKMVWRDKKMIKRCLDVKLNVQPLCFGLVHKFAYEGPCRFSSGDALTNEYDKIAAQQVFSDFKDDLAKNIPDFVELREPLYFECNDDWLLPQENFDQMMKDLGEIDVYLIHSGIARERQIIELAERSKKPILLSPRLGCMITSITASLYSRGLETYAANTWSDLIKEMNVLRTKKAVQNANVLAGVRFNSNTSYACNDSFISLPKVTEVFGTHFRYVNLHEFFDYIHPLPEGGNYTTPGRMDTPNLTDEDVKKAESLADELIGGAEPDNLDIERTYVINSCKIYVLVEKLLNLYDCNGFTFPCPDACSTMRMNKEEFTFCLNHSLLTEQGIPSTCDSDINSMMAMFMLTTLSDKAPSLGNAWPVLFDDSGNVIPISSRFDLENDLANVTDHSNLYLVDHSSQIRKKKGICCEPSKYGLRHFAFDKKFGAVFRYDFNQDVGQKITICRFSPDCRKMLIGTGTVVCGGGYYTDNCNNYVIFRVNDQKKFYQAHKYTGNHLALAYGDYVEELKLLADAFGLEALMV